MTEREKLIVIEIKENKQLHDPEITEILKSKYPKIFKELRFDTLRRYISMLRKEHSLQVDRKVDWSSIYKKYEQIKKKYPDRSIIIISIMLSKIWNVKEGCIRRRLYNYRRYGV